MFVSLEIEKKKTRTNVWAYFFSCIVLGFIHLSSLSIILCNAIFQDK